MWEWPANGQNAKSASQMQNRTNRSCGSRGIGNRNKNKRAGQPVPRPRHGKRTQRHHGFADTLHPCRMAADYRLTCWNGRECFFEKVIPCRLTILYFNFNAAKIMRLLSTCNHCPVKVLSRLQGLYELNYLSGHLPFATFFISSAFRTDSSMENIASRRSPSRTACLRVMSPSDSASMIRCCS